MTLSMIARAALAVGLIARLQAPLDARPHRPSAAVDRPSARVTCGTRDLESRYGTRPDPRAGDPHDPGGVPGLGGAAGVRPVRAYRRHRGRDGARARLAQPAQGL